MGSGRWINNKSLRIKTAYNYHLYIYIYIGDCILVVRCIFLGNNEFKVFFCIYRSSFEYYD